MVQIYLLRTYNLSYNDIFKTINEKYYEFKDIIKHNTTLLYIIPLDDHK